MLLVMLAAVAAVPSCKVEDARYELRRERGVTARFEDVDSGPDWPSGLVLAIHFAGSGRTLWWLPWNGGTDGRQHVASTTDVAQSAWKPPNPDGGPRPYGDLDYFGTDAGYTLLDSVPARGKPAPAHFLLPQLGQAAWGHGRRPGDSAPQQFFDLVSCSPHRS